MSQCLLFFGTSGCSSGRSQGYWACSCLQLFECSEGRIAHIHESCVALRKKMSAGTCNNMQFVYLFVGNFYNDEDTSRAIS